MASSTTKRSPAPPAIPSAIVYDHHSDDGKQRSNNEDRAYVNPALGIFMVIDGMGGQAAGEKAAEVAEGMICRRLERQVDSIENRIRQAVVLANNEICRLAETREEWRGMACVLTVAVIEGEQVTIGHVGDTRLYKLRLGSIHKVTLDHSPVGEREDNGELLELDAMQHPRRNEVYRDVGSQPRGMDDEGFVDILHETLEPDSALLLCSDGLSDLLTKEQIRRLVEAHAESPYDLVHQLIDAANDAGGKDNITVVFAAGPRYAAAVRAGTLPPAEINSYDDAPTRPGLPAAYREPAVAVPVPALPSSRGQIDQRHESAYQSPPPSTSHVPTFMQPAREEQERQRRAAAASYAANREANGMPPYLLPNAESQPTHSKTKQMMQVTLGSGLLLAVAIGLFYLYASFDPQGGPPKPTPTRTPVVGGGARTLSVGEGKEFKKISQALEAAQSGDTIEVEPGKYAEKLTWREKELTLLGGEGVTIELPERLAADHTAVQIIDGAGGRFEGFRIRGKSDNPLTTGILISGNANVALARLEISDAIDAGIDISGHAEVTIRDSDIHHNPGVGIRVRKATVRLSNVELRENGKLGKGKNYEVSAAGELTIDGRPVNPAN